MRNRKAYFKALVQSAARAKGGRPLKVLNVASGPCRDVAELLAECPDLAVHITCVDLDEQAIAHAQRLCAAWPDWLLIHRSPEQLRALAAQAGAPDCRVEAEPEGVNLFLRVRASANLPTS